MNLVFKLFQLPFQPLDKCFILHVWSVEKMRLGCRGFTSTLSGHWKDIALMPYCQSVTSPYNFYLMVCAQRNSCHGFYFIDWQLKEQLLATSRNA